MHSHSIQHETLRDTGLAHQRINLCTLTCQWSPFLPDIHLFLSRNVSFSSKRDLDLSETTCIKIKQKLIHPWVINYKPHISETLTLHILILGSRQGRFQLSVQPIPSSWWKIINIQLFLWSSYDNISMPVYWGFFFFSPNSATQAFLFHSFFFLFFSVSYTAIHCWIGSIASECLSSLGTAVHILPESGGDAAICCPGASEPQTPPPPSSSVVHVLTSTLEVGLICRTACLSQTVQTW